MRMPRLIAIWLEYQAETSSASGRYCTAFQQKTVTIKARTPYRKSTTVAREGLTNGK